MASMQPRRSLAHDNGTSGHQHSTQPSSSYYHSAYPSDSRRPSGGHTYPPQGFSQYSQIAPSGSGTDIDMSVGNWHPAQYDLQRDPYSNHPPSVPEYEYIHNYFGNTPGPQQYQGAYENQRHSGRQTTNGFSAVANMSVHNVVPSVVGASQGANNRESASQPRIPHFPLEGSNYAEVQQSARFRSNTIVPTPSYHQQTTYSSPSIPRHASYVDSPPSPHSGESPNISVTVLHPGGGVAHRTQVIPISDMDRARYIRRPTAAESSSPGWRPGNVKCVFEGCNTSVEQGKVDYHLALHIHGKKAYECICGARFGRLSEANRHVDDQSPCEKCRESRRKHKGTRICARCIGSTSFSSSRG